MQRLRTYINSLILAGLTCLPVTTQADIITAIGSANQFDDIYSFEFTIEEDISDTTLFHATLTNTSPDDNDPAGSNPVIDLLAFNLAGDPVLGTDFIIDSVSPDWMFVAGGSGGVLFDYVGDANSPSDRIAIGESLTFDIDFVNDVDLDIFTLAETDAGTGIGGGEDIGQVAVSFQSLGLDNDFSDLVAANFFNVPPPNIIVPEPRILALFSLGLMLMAGFLRRRRA